MTDPAGLIADERNGRSLRQILQSTEMSLQILFLQQKLPYMLPIAAEQCIAVFGPGKKRRIVKNMDPHLRLPADHFSGPRGRIFRYDPGKRFTAVQDIVEVVQGFHSGKTGLRVFTEQRHEAGVPNPDIGIAERLVHVRRLRHSGQVDQVIVRQFPGFPIQSVQFRLPVVNGNRNPRPPLLVRRKQLAHCFTISRSNENSYSFSETSYCGRVCGPQEPVPSPR